MDNKTVLSENELIASFMGARVRRVAGPLTGEWYYEVKITPNANWQVAHYDTSWNWLMPVVEKINDGFGTINIDSDSVFIHSENELLNHIYNYQSDSGKIGAVYAAVIFFIKWYNSTKTL